MRNFHGKLEGGVFSTRVVVSFGRNDNDTKRSYDTDNDTDTDKRQLVGRRFSRPN